MQRQPFSLSKKSGKAILHDNGKNLSLVTSLLAAFTDGYSTYAGGKAPVEHFTRAASQGNFSSRGLSVISHRTRPDGSALLFYGQEHLSGGPFHKIPGDGQPTHAR